MQYYLVLTIFIIIVLTMIIINIILTTCYTASSLSHNHIPMRACSAKTKGRQGGKEGYHHPGEPSHRLGRVSAAQPAQPAQPASSPASKGQTYE
jgi:hypothetical protein